MAIIYCLARQGSQGYATPAKGLEDNLTLPLPINSLIGVAVVEAV